MKALFSLLAAASMSAFAAPVEVIAEAVSGDVRLQLTRQQGPCQGNARLIVFLRGSDSPLLGCYKPVQVGPQTLIAVNWLDGDRDMIPLSEFKAPGGV
jgi:hypothetical protein